MAFQTQVPDLEQLYIQSELDRNSNLSQHKQSSSNKTYSQDAPSVSIRPAYEHDFVSTGHDPVVSKLQLINEVKGIYAGPVTVEKMFIKIVAQQSNSTKCLENQHWKALVALHQTFLQEHHDFISASQHPVTSVSLKWTAVSHTMPTRLWRLGIHALLELLRHRLPDCVKCMLSFIYPAYSIMASIKQSVLLFVETWIECLWDSVRYRMAIEDSGPRDGTIWSNLARTWYIEAADKSPNTGRIQHHLAVLARPQIVEQLFYYTKALTSVVPFVNARDPIMLPFAMFGTRNSKSWSLLSVYVVFKSASADKLVQTIRHLISTRIVRASKHYSISRAALLGLLLPNLPMTLALPTQPKPRISDTNMHESIVVIVSWVVFLGLSISIPFLRSRVHPDNQITTAVYPAYASGVAIICAGDTGIAGLVKGMIQGCWMGFTIWYYLATTALNDRNWTHIPRYLLPFVIIYQLLSTSRMGDAEVRPDLSTCVPYLSLCLTVTLNAVLFEYSGRIKRLAQRLWAACFHEHLPQ